jgi:hypothetical protein
MQSKIREEFEDWFECKNGFRLTKERDGSFSIPWANDMLEAWVGSRATLVVELPSVQKLGFISEPIMDADDVKYALDDAGVSYK